MPDDARDELARRQEALVAALTAAASDPPDGFDARQVATAAAALASKRMHAAAKSWPALADALGESFERMFGRYAALHPLPAAGHAEDARRFLRFAIGLSDLDEVTALRLLPLTATRLCAVRLRRVRGGVVVAIGRGRRRRPWVIRLARDCARAAPARA